MKPEPSHVTDTPRKGMKRKRKEQADSSQATTGERWVKRRRLSDPSHVTDTPRKGMKRKREEPADSSQATTGERWVKRRRLSDPEEWLPDLGLDMDDKKHLQGTGMICTSVLLAAVQLLKQQFQDASGLPCIRYVGSNIQPTTEPTIQLHADSQRAHSFVTACDGRKVVVADSCYQDFGDVALNQIQKSYKDYVKDPVKNCTLLMVEQQESTILDKYSCVVHSIANAYELLASIGNALCGYNRQCMRPHLLQCFINRRITEFPKDYSLGLKCQPWERPFNWQRLPACLPASHHSSRQVMHVRHVIQLPINELAISFHLLKT
ncbi:uncharacterized protein [Hyperolius riggenbachi]|uniref:uncharacterized protein n=1 Tax=Hyperolius riggenbachi TaxID=752182 RepID=UPI0035A344F1